MWIRDTAEDIVLEHVGPNRDQRVAIPRGTRLVVDGIGLRKYLTRRITNHIVYCLRCSDRTLSR